MTSIPNASRRKATMRRNTMALAAMAVLGIALTGNAPARGLATNSHAGGAMVAKATALRKGDTIMGVLPSTEPLHIEVALKLRNRSQLDSFVAGANLPNAALAHHTMSPDQLTSQHLPTVEQALKVADFLTRSGFHNVVIAPNRMLVSADGTAEIAQSAFATSMARVQTAEGRQAFANTGQVHIPAALQDIVLSVIGLQNVHQAHLHMLRLNPNGLQTKAATGHNPTEFSSIYGGTGVATAAGVTVGIITQGSISQTITDLNTFTSTNGLPTVTTQTVNTNGTSTDTAGLGEWNLDSQDIVGMGGGRVGKLIFYNIPTLSNTDLTADINTAVTANAAKIINVSLGECETAAQGDGSAAAQDQSFATAAAQGQTFSISTGDSGADECGDGGVKASWPAASQFVVAVSGTRLDASTTTWNSEVVWNDLPNNGATGGSPSTFEPKPSWQNALVPGTKRGVADVAFTGSPSSGAKVIVNGAIQQIGGTSLSAPIFAGMWARVIAVKGTSVGFAGQLLYALPASDFHDITSGNNSGETAGPGYDFATGRGSVILSSAINHIGGSTKNALQNGVPVSNLAATTGNELTFTMAVPAGASNLKFTIAGGTGDADLYVKFGSAPTTSVFDCRPFLNGNAETCTVATPQVGTYFVKVRAFASFTGVTLTGSYSTTTVGPFFQNATAFAINDLSTIQSPIAVSSVGGNAPATLKVGVNITHTFIGDLKIDLISPNGTSFSLWNRTGGSTHNISQTFTVNASAVTANGTWKLQVADQAAGDTGTLNSWSIQF